MFKASKTMKWTDWAQEYAAVLGSTASFIAMVALLATSNGKVVKTWKGITLNAVVSILSLVMKASLGFVFAECLAQWKWILFARESRRLIDFDRIDAATRGPLGSLRVLARTKGPIPLWLGAAVTLLVMGLDPFTQQLVQFRSSLISEPSAAALTSHSSIYVMGTASSMRTVVNGVTEDIYGMTELSLSMKSAILTGLSRPLSEVSQQALVQCPTGNCTWAPFRTLGVCSRCTNVTTSLRRVGGIGSSLISFSDAIVGRSIMDEPSESIDFPSTAYTLMAWRSCDLAGYRPGSLHAAAGAVPVQPRERAFSRPYTLPSGHYIANVDGCPPYNGFDRSTSCVRAGIKGVNALIDNNKYTMTSFGTGNPNKTVTMKDVEPLIWSTSFIYPSVPAVNAASSPIIWPDVPLQATECALYYCVKAIDSRMEGNQLHENITEYPSRLSPLDPLPSVYNLEYNPVLPNGAFGSQVKLVTINTSDNPFRVTDEPVMAISSYIQSFFLVNYTDSHGAFDILSSVPGVRQYLDTTLGIPGAVGLNGASFGPSTPSPGKHYMLAFPRTMDSIWSWNTTNVTSVFYALATSMTNEMRRNNGTAGQDEMGMLKGATESWMTVYEIHWAWGALHALVLVLGILFVAVTVGAEGPLWKS
ncbi:hypothetical protein V495_05544, partial [Pseudogymnoascus sp. VKM F-4514 (FW-929)]